MAPPSGPEAPLQVVAPPGFRPFAILSNKNTLLLKMMWAPGCFQVVRHRLYYAKLVSLIQASSTCWNVQNRF